MVKEPWVGYYPHSLFFFRGLDSDPEFDFCLFSLRMLSRMNLIYFYWLGKYRCPSYPTELKPNGCHPFSYISSRHMPIAKDNCTLHSSFQSYLFTDGFCVFTQQGHWCSMPSVWSILRRLSLSSAVSLPLVKKIFLET